eukprot:7385320-Prymnesium_polylepis.1
MKKLKPTAMISSAVVAGKASSRPRNSNPLTPKECKMRLPTTTRASAHVIFLDLASLIARLAGDSTMNTRFSRHAITNATMAHMSHTLQCSGSKTLLALAQKPVFFFGRFAHSIILSEPMDEVNCTKAVRSAVTQKSEVLTLETPVATSFTAAVHEDPYLALEYKLVCVNLKAAYGVVLRRACAYSIMLPSHGTESLR